MFSDYLKEHSDGVLVASGNAVRKNPAFGNILTATFARPLYTLRYREETAFGAALYAAIVAGVCDVASAKMCVMYTEE